MYNKNTKLLPCIYFIGTDDGRRWTNLCSSCDVDSNPGEKYIGQITLIECKESCRTDEDCTAIDYGKGSRSMECYHNYGEKTSHGPHSGFDAYILKGLFLDN